MPCVKFHETCHKSQGGGNANCTALIDSYSGSLTNSDIGINSLTYIQQTENFGLVQKYSDSKV